MNLTHPVILFDGVCHFCNSGVNFLIDRDHAKKLRFTPLQSPLGQELLKKFNLSITDFDTVVLIENDQAHLRSTAILKALGYLPFPHKIAKLNLLIPQFIRDAVYRWIAKNRYQWFGKADTCRVPTPEIQERFWMEKAS